MRIFGVDWLAALLALVVLAGVPWLFGSGYIIGVMTVALCFGMWAASWDFMSGLTGRENFGHSLFIGTGAYTAGFLNVNFGVNPWWSLLAAPLVAVAFSLAVGFPTLRLRGPYFALTTIAFTEILRIYVENTESGPFGLPLRAAMGLLIPLRGNSPAMFQFTGKVPYYYIALGMMCVSVGVSYAITRTRLGYYLAAIRGDRDAAESLGVNITRYNMMAMAVSCFLTALGGTFYAQYFAYIDPTITFGPSVSIGALLPAIVGGAGTVLGPVLGSFVLTPLSELTRYALRGRAGADIMLYGAILVLVISFLPQGIVGLVRERRARAGQR